METRRDTDARLRLLRRFRALLRRWPAREILWVREPLPPECGGYAPDALRLNLTTRGRREQEIPEGGALRRVVTGAETVTALLPGCQGLRPPRPAHRHLGLVFAPTHLRCIDIVCEPHAEPETRYVDVYHTRRPPEEAMRALGRALVALGERGAPAQTAVALVRILVTLAAEALESDRPTEDTRARARWEAITEYVREHAHEPIDRAAVARALGMSPTHVSRLFKRFGPTRFTAWLTELRLERAERMLRQTALPVRLVAARCGFGDPDYFIHVFRRRHGRPPGRWRRQEQAG